jgi:hypothetical protein
MKNSQTRVAETELLLQLVAKIKIAVALESGVVDLKCPCGMVIIPRTPLIPNLKDQQRGLMKSRIKRHLRERHGLSEHTTGLFCVKRSPKRRSAKSPIRAII